MTDQTTTAPPPAAPALSEPVWRRLVTDCAAFQRQYPTPAHLAELVQQAILAGWQQGVVFGLTPRAQAQPNEHLLEYIIAKVMNRAAAAAPGDGNLTALHALAHAGQRARAHVATAADTGETTTGGRSDG